MLLSFPEALLSGINFYYLYTVYVLGRLCSLRTLGVRASTNAGEALRRRLVD